MSNWMQLVAICALQPLSYWIVQWFTSPPTQYRLYGRRFFTGQKTQPTVSKYWRKCYSHSRRWAKGNNNTVNQDSSTEPDIIMPMTVL